MTFEEMVKHLYKGERIRRKKWEKLNDYIWASVDGFITRSRFSSFVITPLTKEDIKANDWEIYTNEKYFDFDTAYKLLLEGKCLSRKYWNDKGIYLFMENGTVYDNDDFTVRLAGPMLNAKDWYVVEED